MSPQVPVANKFVAWLMARRDDLFSAERQRGKSIHTASRCWPVGVWLTLILGLHAALLAWSAAVQSPTLDEAFHLAGGIRHWHDGRFDIDRGNPPLVGALAALPVIAVGAETDWHRAPNSFLVGSDFLKVNGSRAFWLITLARWAVLPLSLWGGIICFLWAKELGGNQAGLLCVVLWCFCPQILAFGSLVTGDMAATVMGLTTLFAFWKWLRKPCWERAVVCGFVWGLAELSKFVWLFLYLLCPLLWLAWRWIERRERPWGRTVLREFGQGLAMVLLSLYVINMGYLCEGFGQPLKSFHVGQKVLRWFDTPEKQSSPFKRYLSECPVPLPSDYLGGLGEITQFVSAKPPSYLRGEYRSGGWWYFYLYGWGVKLPLGTWLIIGLAGWVGVLQIHRRQFSADQTSSAFLLVVTGAVLTFVTVTSGVQFLRYTLPVLPFVLIWASQIAAKEVHLQRGFHTATAFGVLWTVMSSLFVFPHSLSYFNELAGGPRNGDQQLIDDSFDWGQDLLMLRHWLNAHPEVQPLNLAYWGWTDPRAAGIEFDLPPRRSEMISTMTIPLDAKQGSDDSRQLLTEGWYAVSVGLSHGGPWIRIHNGAGNEAVLSHGDFHYFRNLTPVATAGYSIRIFYLDEQTADAISDSLVVPR